MKTKLLKNGFLTLFSFIFVLPVFSQDFNRVIELKNPRMNGQDVLALQKRLLEFTFYELGEADGYYGPMTEGVIKKIQASWDLPVTGIVNKEFWDIIFDEWRSSYWLPQKSIYYRNNLERSRNLGIGIYGSGDYIDEIFVYYTLEDKKIKVIDSKDGKLMFDINMSCYFINENDYRVEFSLSGQSYFIEETGFETEKGNIYYVINGVLYRDINDTRVRQNDKRIINNIINRINAIKSEFSARY
jgi:hypothetical protein